MFTSNTYRLKTTLNHAGHLHRCEFRAQEAVFLKVRGPVILSKCVIRTTRACCHPLLMFIPAITSSIDEFRARDTDTHHIFGLSYLLRKPSIKQTHQIASCAHPNGRPVPGCVSDRAGISPGPLKSLICIMPWWNMLVPARMFPHQLPHLLLMRCLENRFLAMFQHLFLQPRLQLFKEAEFEGYRR